MFFGKEKIVGITCKCDEQQEEQRQKELQVTLYYLFFVFVIAFNDFYAVSRFHTPIKIAVVPYTITTEPNDRTR